MSTNSTRDVYNEIALMILDDQGQVEIAELVEEGDLSRAQLLILVHADRLCEVGKLSFAQGELLQRRLGVSQVVVAEIRDSGMYIGVRGILRRN